MTYSILSWVKLGLKSSFKNYFRLLLVFISYTILIFITFSLIVLPILQPNLNNIPFPLNLYWLVAPILIILIPGITIGQTKAILNIARNQPCNLFHSYLSYIKPHRLVEAWGFFFVYLTAIVTGLALGVIPGIYLYSIWFVALYLLIEKNESVLNCFSQSTQLIKKVGVLRIIGLGVLMFAIIVVISICSIPLIYLIDFIIMSNGIELPYSDVGTIVSYFLPIFTAPIQYMVSAQVYLSVVNEYVESSPQDTMKIS